MKAMNNTQKNTSTYITGTTDDKCSLAAKRVNFYVTAKTNKTSHLISAGA